MKEPILIVYFSQFGSTQRIAEMIQKRTGGELVRIFPENPYPESRDALLAQAKKEIESGYRPPLKSLSIDVQNFETIFVGTPNWWSSLTPPMASFLEGQDLSGKVIAPFVTHGGGGLGHVDKDIAKLCPNSIIKPALAIYGSDKGKAASLIEEWLAKMS